MRGRLGLKCPKKPSRFTRIGAVKRYLFCSNYDEFFDLGEDGMVQVDFIDYGLGWENLKKGESGNMMCFEIVDFEAITPEEQVLFERRWEKRMEVLNRQEEIRRCKHKMRRRIERIILGGLMRRFYWLPGLTHGRMVLSIISQFGFQSLSTLEVRLGAYLVAMVQSHCLIRFSFS